ncbi:putative bifunctional diguanylate cyclase/phosphodiesterase [Nonomuraea longicatena]|uniref:Uncharacterized protein n=1 Tax=Nonomuraea longicatena TaxID=83682 RepID=A0ABP3ZGM4_9ACTN
MGFAGATAAGWPALTTGTIAGLSAALLASVSLFLTAGRFGGTGARWLGSGALVWSAGLGLRSVADSSGVFVSVSDLLVPAGTLLMAAGALICAGRAPTPRSAVRHLLDAYLCTASLVLVGWVLALRQLLADAGGSSSLVFTLLPPAICLLATFAAAPAVAGGAVRTWPLGLAGVGVLAATTVAEAASAVARLGESTPPTWSLVLAPVAFMLLAAAAWSRRREEDERRLRGAAYASQLLTVIPLALVVVATLVYAGYFAGGPEHRPAGGVVLIVASVVMVLVLRLFALVTAYARMRRLVRLGDRQLRQLAESTGDVVLMCDYDGVITEIGAGVEVIYGYRPEEVVGRSLFDYLHPEDTPGIQAALHAMGPDEVEDDPGACLVECRVLASDGTWRPSESVATRHVGGEDLLLITTRDVSDEQALRDQVAHLTFHDGVTGLPNRSYFAERTREVLDGRAVVQAAVIFLDLDGFTSVNDSVGHASGDYLLGQAARRLRGAVRPDDTLARWGGDEFAVLVDTGGEAQVAVDLAERLVRAVSQEPFRVADRDIALTASVGVAFAEDDTPAGDLMRNADVAMARAKELGGRRVEVFAAHMHADVVRRLELAADLQRALIEQQFAIEYQPVVDLATSRVTAVEALVRWWRGSVFVPPEQFLGPAEDTGLIVPLSEWILRESCREVAAWRASSWDIGLSVNLSARQITAPRFVETVAEALEDSGLPASALTLEVIEEMLVEDAEETISRLSELRALGVRLAIDDFGTGYASLAFLRQLPVDMIKIDPSFVEGLGRDDTLTLLTRTIVRLGHDLGLIVVAEGIERPEQLEQLREMGCTRGQGFLVARPMAAKGVDSLMRTSLQSAL